jgi:hypothetical protein
LPTKVPLPGWKFHAEEAALMLLTCIGSPLCGLQTLISQPRKAFGYAPQSLVTPEDVIWKFGLW